MTNYNLVVQCLMNHSFSLKAFPRHKIYLFWNFFNPYDSNICKFVCRASNIVKHLNHFSSFGTYQGFTDEKIVDLVKFSLIYNGRNS